MYRIRTSKLTIVEASDTGMKLMVYNDKNKKASADLLSEIITRMFKLRNFLITNKENFPEYKQYIELLKDNFNDERTKIYENDPTSDLTSFSVNKGEEVTAKVIKLDPEHKKIALSIKDYVVDKNKFNRDDIVVGTSKAKKGKKVKKTK
jgi:hypothetical protein